MSIASVHYYQVKMADEATPTVPTREENQAADALLLPALLTRGAQKGA